MVNDNRSVQVRHPAPHDLVGEAFNVAGIGTGFEGTVAWRLIRRDGQVISEGGVQAGGMGVMGDFSLQLSVAEHELPPDEPSLELQVFGDNPALPDEGPDPGFDVNTIPLTAGYRLIDGYWGFTLHEVAPGDTLAKIASQQVLGSTSAAAIYRANHDVLNDPDLIHPGQVLRVPLGA